jgi:hypothetical protein
VIEFAGWIWYNINMIKMLKVTSFIATLVIISAPTLTYGAGHFALAFQRQLSAWENGSPEGCLGNHVCRVWVWDEDGNPMPNIGLYTTWDVLMDTTDIDGRAEIPIYENDYDLKCVDGQGSTSESTLLMTTRRYECYGHYSFEVGFLYKTDATNPGEFDLDLNGTWNYRDTPQDDDAPYTKSLAYSGVDCTDYWSDRSDLGHWQTPPSYFGQTFIATGDRVVSARVHGVIGGNDLLDWKLRIVTFPGLQPVGEETSVPYRWPFGWEAFWGVNDCPVVPGQTYMLQAWRDGDGMNIWRVNKDVYPDGQYYEGTEAFPGLDLNGHICCMTYGSAKGPDLNEDGRIDFKDYCKLAKHWLQDEKSVDIAPPPNGDGVVDSNDLAVFIENWLTATTIPPLPEQASNPSPSNGASGVASTTTLSWTAGSGAISHDVYIGTDNPPPFIINLTTTTISPGWFNASTTFYWRIDEINGWGKTTGELWEFRTAMTPPPPPPPPPPP